MNRKFSLRELRAFCAAAEHESFRVAAEQLYLTASAVSHQIRNLEDQLGKKLFLRSSRAIELTNDGAALYTDVYPLLLQLDEAVARHGADSAGSSLKISVQPFFASELFVPRLPAFRERHPDIAIAVDTSDESLQRHPADADVSIRVFRTPPANLECAQLFPLRLVPAGSPKFYDSIKVVSGRIVGDFPIVIHETRGRAWRQWERASGISLPRNPTTVRLDSMIAVVRAAERGLGAALVPRELSESWFESGSLVHLFETELLTDEAFYLVYDGNHKNLKTVEVFREWVLQEFATAA